LSKSDKFTSFKCTVIVENKIMINTKLTRIKVKMVFMLHMEEYLLYKQ
jgi:hypothetical protein